jgi:hypothetical protein
MLTSKRSAIALMLLAAAAPAFITPHGVPGRPQTSARAAHYLASPAPRASLMPRITVPPALLPVLLTLGLARAASAAAAAAPTCAAPLTLRLKPGLRYGRTVALPGPDIPPGAVVIHVPLYPGAVPTTQRLVMPTFDYPATPYLKAAIAEYLLPTDTVTAEEWYRQRFAPCGYTVTGTGESHDAHGHSSTGITFTSRSNANLTVQLSFEDVPHGGTLLLYVAEDVTVPPRPPGSYLPGDIVRVNVTYLLPLLQSGGVQRRLHRTITSPAAIHRLVAALNALSHIVPGRHTCPADNGQSATLVFVRRNGRTVRVYDEPVCVGVVVGHFPPLIDDHDRVWATITALVYPGPPSSRVRQSARFRS